VRRGRERTPSPCAWAAAHLARWFGLPTFETAIPEIDAEAAAMKLAVEGNLLHRHPADQAERRRVIVARFAGERPNEEVRHRVLDILSEYPVKTVPPEGVATFAEQVRCQAH